MCTKLLAKQKASWHFLPAKNLPPSSRINNNIVTAMRVMSEWNDTIDVESSSTLSHRIHLCNWLWKTHIIAVDLGDNKLNINHCSPNGAVNWVQMWEF